ncbi:MAG: hypothetical protein Q7S01_02515 [bacterium]|nr:hypothetical protein [bacterium]
MKTIQRFVLAILAALLFTLPAFAQTPPQPPQPIPLPAAGVWSPLFGIWNIDYFLAGHSGADRNSGPLNNESFQFSVDSGELFEGGSQFYRGHVNGVGTVEAWFHPNDFVWVARTNEWVRRVYITLIFNQPFVEGQETRVTCTCLATLNVDAAWGSMYGQSVEWGKLDTLHSNVAGWKPSVYGSSNPGVGTEVPTTR